LNIWQKSYNKGKQTQEKNLDSLGLDMGKKPPQALDIEEAVLGALMLEPNLVPDTMEILTPAVFTRMLTERSSML
jgi:DnaB-like helicase N terminal domain.